jgi:hypothetical protein
MRLRLCATCKPKRGVTNSAGWRSSLEVEVMRARVCDRERYVRVEDNIRPGFAALLRGEEVDIVSGKPIEDESINR